MSSVPRTAAPYRPRTPGTIRQSRGHAATGAEPGRSAGTLSPCRSSLSRSGAEPADRWPRQSRVATAALVLGILAIPFGLLVYPGVLLGAVAVLLRGGSACSSPAAAGRWAGPGPGSAWSPVWSRSTIALSLGWQGLRTVRDCENRLGHRPDHAEIQTCIRDGL